jgi:stage II sporulation protein D
MSHFTHKLAALLVPRIERCPRRVVLPATWLALPAMLFLLLLYPGGCASHPAVDLGAPTGQVVRVLLAENVDQAQIAAAQPPIYITSSDNIRRILNIHGNTPFTVTLAAAGWKVGGTQVGAGEMVLLPTDAGSFTLNGRRYRGEYHLLPRAGGRFDVVNHVDIEDYLRGVLRSELFADWHDQTYRAQAIVARTYALYERAYNEKVSATPRSFDLYDDTRSQVYGGIDAETPKADAAVADTRGVVVAYGQSGQERIFKTYFSSCCGGITQSAYYAFGDPHIDPLGDKNNQSRCMASPKFNWGPVVIKKDELTRRFKAWGAAKNRPEKDIGLITKVEVQQANRWNRPVRFLVTDSAGRRYSLMSEEMRWATNAGNPAEGTTLYSSFVNVITDSDAIRFVDGHGYGHGVGMCQWCAETLARAGHRHEDIVLDAFPCSTLKHAY